jgi:hypothetical protein
MSGAPQRLPDLLRARFIRMPLVASTLADATNELCSVLGANCCTAC